MTTESTMLTLNRKHAREALHRIHLANELFRHMPDGTPYWEYTQPLGIHGITFGDLGNADSFWRFLCEQAGLEAGSYGSKFLLEKQKAEYEEIISRLVGVIRNLGEDRVIECVSSQSFCGYEWKISEVSK